MNFTKNEKRVFSAIDSIRIDKSKLVGLSEKDVLNCVQSLMSTGLVSGALSNDRVVRAQLTPVGISLKAKNPNLSSGMSETSKWVINTTLVVVGLLLTYAVSYRMINAYLCSIVDKVFK